MAIYEFACESCGHRFEELVLGSATSSIKCPKCGATKTRRLLSTFGYNGGSGFKNSSGSGGCAICGGGSCSTCH